MPRGRQLDRDLLEAALVGFEQKQAEIDRRIVELRTMLDGRGPQPAAATPKIRRKRRKMSAAARKRIGDAARARWAEFRANQSAKKTRRSRRKAAAGSKS